MKSYEVLWFRDDVVRQLKWSISDITVVFIWRDLGRPRYMVVSKTAPFSEMTNCFALKPVLEMEIQKYRYTS
jgi:hypothetical protein